jgi:hypothetical protein
MQGSSWTSLGKQVIQNLPEIVKTVKQSYKDWSTGQQHFPAYQFLGPGTKVYDKITKGVRPSNKTDHYAMNHDLDFGVISDAKLNPAQLKRAVKNADTRFVKGLESLPKERNNWGNILGRTFISGKSILEDLGVLDPKRFLGD